MRGIVVEALVTELPTATLMHYGQDGFDELIPVGSPPIGGCLISDSDQVLFMVTQAINGALALGSIVSLGWRSLGQMNLRRITCKRNWRHVAWPFHGLWLSIFIR